MKSVTFVTFLEKEMKRFVFLIFIFVSLFACNCKRESTDSNNDKVCDSTPALEEEEQEDTEPRYVTSVHKLPLKIGDTEFIIHESGTSVYIKDTIIDIFQDYQAIYIDRDKKSIHYEKAIDFDLDEYYYPATNTEKRKIPSSLPRRWIELSQYKGNYYIRLIAEVSVFRYEITPTALISLGWLDGDYGFDYSNIEENSKYYTIRGVHREGFPFAESIRIYIIDRARGIAVFEGSGEGQEIRRLFVDASKARNFPLIVQEYSATVVMKPPTPKLPLDSIDFDLLLSKAGLL